MTGIEEWIPIERDYICESCGHKTVITGLGGTNMTFTCRNYDCNCYPSCKVITVYDFDEYNYIELPDGKKVWYECPECNSNEVTRNLYDDGFGYVDVNILCENCGNDTWY